MQQLNQELTDPKKSVTSRDGALYSKQLFSRSDTPFKGGKVALRKKTKAIIKASVQAFAQALTSDTTHSQRKLLREIRKLINKEDEKTPAETLIAKRYKKEFESAGISIIQPVPEKHVSFERLTPTEQTKSQLRMLMAWPTFPQNVKKEIITILDPKLEEMELNDTQIDAILESLFKHHEDMDPFHNSKDFEKEFKSELKFKIIVKKLAEIIPTQTELNVTY